MRLMKVRYTRKNIPSKRISTPRGILIDWSDDCANANDSIRINCEFDSNEIDESDWQSEKQEKERVLTLHGITIFETVEKWRINLWSTISSSKSSTETNLSFPHSIKIPASSTPINEEPSMNSTFRGITMDWIDQSENAYDSIRTNREFDPNEIDESDLHCEKHREPRISTLRGISIEVIIKCRWFNSGQLWIEAKWHWSKWYSGEKCYKQRSFWAVESTFGSLNDHICEISQVWLRRRQQPVSIHTALEFRVHHFLALDWSRIELSLNLRDLHPDRPWETFWDCIIMSVKSNPWSDGDIVERNAINHTISTSPSLTMIASGHHRLRLLPRSDRESSTRSFWHAWIKS
jgi:hypothetical protein